MFLWYFKPMPLRKIFSKEIMPAQKNLLLEGLMSSQLMCPGREIVSSCVPIHAAPDNETQVESSKP